MFTVHAGEFLVGEYLNHKFARKYDVWVPTKDEGVDLLVTRRQRGRQRPVRLQVKFSRGFLSDSVPHDQLAAWGWFTPKPEKIRRSSADLWIFVILTLRCEPYFVVIPTKELRKRIPKGTKGTWHLYLVALKKGYCFDVRGLPQETRQVAYATGKITKQRCYTDYLGNWDLLHLASK